MDFIDRNLPTTLRHFPIQFSDPSFLPSAGSAPSTAVTGSARSIQPKNSFRLCGIALWGVALALSLFLHGCGGDFGQSRAVVSDSAGVRIVENRDAEGDRTSEWSVSPEATLRLGGTSATEEAEQFSELKGVTRLTGGEVVVLEGSLSELRFFSEEGEHVRTIGGKGEGPGEFGGAESFIRLAGDSLLVRDTRRSSLVLFAPDGNYVQSEPVDRRKLWGLANSMWGGWYEPPLPDRSLLEFARTEEREDVPAGESGPTESHPNPLLVRVSRDLLTVDTLGSYLLRHTHFVELPGGFVEFVTHPFFARGRLAISTDPTMIHLSGGAGYSVRRFSQGGALEMIIRRTLPRRKPTGEERAAAWSEAVRDVAPERLGRISRDLSVPDSVPDILGLAAGPDGELWVQREPFVRGQSPAVLDVFDSEGLYLGEIRLATPLHVREVGMDYILGDRRDEFDVPIVELYALQRR